MKMNSNMKKFSVLIAAGLFFTMITASPVFPEAKKAEKVIFNFVDVELPVITKFISEVTKKNFIFDERVKGKITIIAPSKLSIEEAFDLFTSVLDLKGFTVIPSGVDAYKIIPSAEVKQRGIEVARDKKPVNESYMARLIPLKNISSDDALKFLQPMVSRDGYASAFGPGNLILVIDSGLNMEKILSILDSIDQPSMREGPEIVFLKYSGADMVAKMLNEGMSRKRSAGQAMTADETKAVADQRLNALLLFGDKGVRESMKSLIALVDVPSREAQGRINVYFLENADATELAKILEGIIKGTQPQRQAAAAPGTPVVTPFEAVGGITITADKASNALVIVAAPSDYQNLFQVIKQLDKRRRQVYVEAMIIEASVNKLRELGVQWRASATQGGKPIFIGGFGTINNAAIQGIIQGLQGATAGGLGNFLTVPVTTVDQTTGQPTASVLSIPGFAVLFNLNEFRDAVNVLSTPQILTSDNKEAEILVGQNVPFISQSSTTTGLGVSTTGTSVQGVVNSIVRQDVGIILKITPQITEGDHIKLDIYLENSAVVNQPAQITVTVGPTINKRSTKTSVVVKDNQIVVVGGLLQDNNEEQITKVPFLGDIPLIGQLFQSKTSSRQKTNLIVFLNPHVIKEADRLVEITNEKQKEFAVAGQRYAAGELLVKFKEGVSRDEAEAIISEKGASVIKIIEGIQVYHVQLPKGKDVEKAVEEFSAIPQVQYAEPNYQLRLQQTQ